MAYQDSTAYHVVSEASVADVCSKIDSSLKGSVSATNFRPNIIAQDVPAFDEVKNYNISFSVLHVIKQDHFLR